MFYLTKYRFRKSSNFPQFYTCATNMCQSIPILYMFINMSLWPTFKKIVPLQHTCVTITYFCTYAAYMCHHNTFLIHGSLENPTHQRWSLVTHLSIGFSMTLMLILGILGYVSFTGHTQGKTVQSLSLVTVYSSKYFIHQVLSQTLKF